MGCRGAHFDSPFPALRTPAAVLYLILVLAAMWFLRRSYMILMVAFGGFAIVALWWFSLEPSNDRNWQPDNASSKQRRRDPCKARTKAGNELFRANGLKGQRGDS